MTVGRTLAMQAYGCAGSEGALPEGHGMDPRVSATPLRGLLRPRMTKGRPTRNFQKPFSEPVSLPRLRVFARVAGHIEAYSGDQEACERHQ